MDTESAVALVSVAAGGAATAAGQSAWTSLTALVRRALGRESAVSPEDEDGVRALAARIAEAAAADPEFARQLREWAEPHRGLLPDGGSVRNVIADGAHITGPVVQARDIDGGITFE